MKGKAVRVDLTDTIIDYDRYTVKSYDNWSKIWILGDELLKNGKSAIHRTKKIGTKYGFSDITKIYTITKIEQKEQILQEYALIRKIGIFPYFDIAYGKNKNEIMITMDSLNYTLNTAVLHRKNDEIHDFERIQTDTGLKYFILEIAGCLFQLHRLGYAHLDIKPSNCGFRNGGGEKMYVYGNGWKLIDFDITNNKRLLNKYCGTRGWSAPEMSPHANDQKGNNISVANDIWSFGLLILYIINKGTNIFDVTKQEIKKYNLNDKKSKLVYFYDKKLFGENKQTQSQLVDGFICNYLMSLWIKKKIDFDLYQLLSSMLIFNPSKRISALEIVKHKYFKKYIKYRKDVNVYFVKRNQTRFTTPGCKTYKWIALIYDFHNEYRE